MKTLKQKVLDEHGLIEHRPSKGKHTRLVTIPESNLDPLKTPHMRYLELVHKKPIEQLLMAGSLSIVSKKLGIDTSTASRWISKLKLRYSEDNLPQCKGCPRYNKACNVGMCNILADQNLWELVLLKQTELLGVEVDND